MTELGATKWIDHISSIWIPFQIMDVSTRLGPIYYTVHYEYAVRVHDCVQAVRDLHEGACRQCFPDRFLNDPF
jgi:hypothetical protein